MEEEKLEVKLVHPDNKDQMVVATHPQQVAALQGTGFVEVEEETAQDTKSTAKKEAK